LESLSLSSASRTPRLSTPSRVPGDLFESERWYAFRTRSRAEKKVDRLLSDLGIESYVPLIERTSQWSDREKRVRFPLFPGYVFSRFVLTRLHEVLRTPGIVEVVRVNGYPTPVRDQELRSIRELVEGSNIAGIEPDPCDYLTRGQEVEVIDGPFLGLRGILLETRAKARVIVQIAAIRQAVSVEIERRFVRPLEEAQVTAPPLVPSST
jgi:transcriptional antiterminator NusG